MSLESRHGSLPLPVKKKRKSVFLWWREECRGHAHPWSAYRAETYLAGKPPAGIVIATKVGKLRADTASPAPVMSPECSKVATQPSVIPGPVATKQATPVAAHPVLIPEASPTVVAITAVLPAVIETPAPVIAKLEETPAEPQKVAKPSVLKLVPKEPAANPPRPVSARPAASRQNFMLAARLRSVAVLNRAVAAKAATRPIRSANGAAVRATAVRNQPLVQAPVTRRSRTIEPPAVLRTQRKSAEVIQLRLALARAEHRQAKSHKYG